MWYSVPPPPFFSEYEGGGRGHDTPYHIIYMCVRVYICVGIIFEPLHASIPQARHDPPPCVRFRTVPCASLAGATVQNGATVPKMVNVAQYILCDTFRTALYICIHYIYKQINNTLHALTLYIYKGIHHPHPRKTPPHPSQQVPSIYRHKYPHSSPSHTTPEPPQAPTLC